MADLTSADIDMIVDKTICCAGNMAYKAAKEYSYGLKCAKDTLTKVKLLNAYIEILSDYEPIVDEEVPSTGTVAMTGTNGSIQIKVGGQPISAVVAFSASVSTTAGLVATSINSYESGIIDYTATQTPGTGKLTITAEDGVGDIVNGYRITAVTTGDMAISGAAATLVMAGGIPEIADGDSVVTEAEALLIIESIASICDLCFPPSGSTYS